MPKPAKFNTLIGTYVDSKNGTIITPNEIIDAVKCTAPTAYAYIKNNPSRFEKVSAGKYRILAVSNSHNLTLETE